MSKDLKDTKSVQVTVISERLSKSNGKYSKPNAWPPKPGLDKTSDEYTKHSLDGTKWTAALVKHISLHDALTTTFVDPTYFMSFAPTKAARRLNYNLFDNKEALAYIGGCVEIQMAIFDVDCHQEDESETEEERYSRVSSWFQDELEKIERLQEDMPGILAYRSKNGYRIVALLETPIRLTNREDCQEYKRLYTGWVKFLARKYGMKSTGKETPDDLGDFNRFQRVPHDNNKSALQQSPHEVFGDVEKIGYWCPELSAKDLPEKKALSTTRAQDSYSDSEGCLLLELVQARGLRCEAPYQQGKGDFDICCPDADRHSPNANGEKDYPGKTYLYLGRLGAIHCFSEGCQHRKSDPMLWVRECFTEEELKAAEKKLDREWKPGVYDPNERDRERAADEEAHKHFCLLSEFWKETDAANPQWTDSDSPEFKAWYSAKGYVETVEGPISDDSGDPILLDSLVKTKKGVVIWTKSNVEVALKYLGLKASYDMLASKFMVEGIEGKGPVVEDLLIEHLNIVLKEQLRFGLGDVYKFLQQICWDNRFHPIHDYLEGLKWDGTPRLDTWLIDHGGAEDSKYTRAVSHLPLLAMVRRVYEPGAKFDELLVLQSDQGKVKSTALLTLMPNPDWFTDSLPIGAQDKEIVEKTAGKWLVEFADLHGLSGRDHNTLKACLSRRVETCRPAFARVGRDFPRQFVAIGTINETEYLTDPTGNRRYWPVNIKKAFDLEKIKAVRDQIWAEAYVRHCKGESIRLDQSLWQDAAEKQKEAEVQNPIKEKLALIVSDKSGKIPASVLWDVLNVPLAQRSGNARLNSAMVELGWTYKTLKINGVSVKGFYKGDGKTTWLTAQNKHGEWELVTKSPKDLRDEEDELELELKKSKDCHKPN